ncbi:MAG TPA: RsmB/NOP family class I SAM-dependent RNA methyltransferase [Chitinophagales bacterium]|nr:RsmB/NOP family class I SAM-dependent RNA methyltransferase [Chitinophagales bacterium]HNN26020.1 RsmB/NOP family class I SAM-dependent RNA methyltransferase [Chitinophagales bacterium]
MQEIKVHPPILNTITLCLKAIFEAHQVADKVVANTLQENKNFGARDRSTIAETVYDIVRWKLKYEYQLAQLGEQFTYYKHLVFVSFVNRNYTIKNIELFDITNSEVLRLNEIIQKAIDEKYIEQSYPKTFYDLCLDSIGASWHQIAKALNVKPSVYIRVNSLKTSAANLIEILLKEGIEIEAQAKNSYLKILSKNNLKNSLYYKQGLFEFQDIGSQEIGNFLFHAIEDKSKIDNISILDLCAGAGGKSLHLSALLNNRGKIYATDYHAARLKNLQLRATQAGCKNIEIIDFKTVKNLKNIDILLIDAPCSGSGTFKRQADLKYKISVEKINEYTQIQENLLATYISTLKKNGKIVYATCSILPQENQLQIQNFLAKNIAQWQEKQSQQLLPTMYDGDGFFMTLLERKDK